MLDIGGGSGNSCLADALRRTLPGLELRRTADIGTRTRERKARKTGTAERVRDSLLT